MQTFILTASGGSSWATEWWLHNPSALSFEKTAKAINETEKERTRCRHKILKFKASPKLEDNWHKVDHRNYIKCRANRFVRLRPARKKKEPQRSTTCISHHSWHSCRQIRSKLRRNYKGLLEMKKCWNNSMLLKNWWLRRAGMKRENCVPSCWQEIRNFCCRNNGGPPNRSTIQNFLHWISFHHPGAVSASQRRRICKGKILPSWICNGVRSTRRRSQSWRQAENHSSHRRNPLKFLISQRVTVLRRVILHTWCAASISEATNPI